MKYHAYKMTLQGKIAVIHLAAIAALFATLNNARLSIPGLKSLCWYSFQILIFPIGSIGMLQCPIGLFDIIFVGVAFALNAYLWAWLIVRLISRMKLSLIHI